MRLILKDFIISIISIAVLLFFLYFSINHIIKKPIKIINFVDSEVHQKFEIEISKNLSVINNFLKDYPFIQSYKLSKKKNEANITIILKKPFARNNRTREVIFYDNTTAPFEYFKLSYLNNIKLSDISDSSIYINKYLSENFEKLSALFNIVQIEYIDQRRYNLVLTRGRIVMLPKVIDSQLIFFIQNNINLIEKNSNYNEFLDLRNFHKKTIRLK